MIKTRTNKSRITRSTIVICTILLHALATVSWAGELIEWGQIYDPPVGNDFADVSAGAYHNIALKTDGSLVAWGLDTYGQVSYTPAGNDFAAVAAGLFHSVALKTDGSLVAWGRDNYSQVYQTPTGNDFVAVTAGANHNIALKSDGSLVPWGLMNQYHQVSDTPTGNDFIAVAAGPYHNVALKTDGSLVSWGNDTSGQVSETPTGNDFVAVAAGSYHNVALKSDGSLVAWGFDHEATNPPAGNDFVAISAGKTFNVALKSDGSLISWGDDSDGQVSDTPEGNDFIAVSAGYNHTVVIRDTESPPPTTYTLSTSVSPTSYSGYVTKNPDKSSYNSNESVQLTATAYSGYTFSHWSGDVSSYANPVTIIMNSNKSVTANFTAITKPTVSITATDAYAAEPANDGYFTISRTGDTTENLLVYYSTSGSTATAGADYAALSGYVYILSGQSSASIAVDVIDDFTVENSETVKLTISSNAAYNIGSPSYATVTITDNDDEPPVDETIVTITTIDASAGEPSNHGYFAVSRAGDTSSSLKVYYSTGGSTASAGIDYAALSGYVDILPGQSWAVIYVVVYDDSIMESSETVQLTISSNAAYTIGSPSSATVTIADDDDIPLEKPVVTITATDASAGEPSNDGYFTVSRTGDTSGNLLVYYSTAGSTASAGTDYAALSGYVYIYAGQSSASISVDVIDDYTVESSETVNLTISSNASYTVGSPSSATVTIADDDDIPVEKPVVTITAPDSLAGEPSNDGYFTVSRTGDTSSSLLVYYSTAGSTASAGYDYAALSGYVYIYAGQSSASIPVDVTNDYTVESSEMVKLTISSNAAYTIGNPSNATVTITDDDDVPEPPDDNAEQMMADTLIFFYASVDDGSLVSTGRGNKELTIFKKMLETAYDEIVGGDYAGACGQLTEAYARCDSDNDIPDYVEGSATTTLAAMIQEVINELGCS